MDKEKTDIVKSILRFLHDEIESSKLDMEQKESLEVAKQCLESTYEIDTGDASVLSESVNLYNLFNVTSEVTEDAVKAAEELKVRGNNHMKSGQYSEALDLYTQAIDLNPKNHVFYCNRAAAYSRLEKHWNAVADCKESIKLNPTAKAYGRLGVAYSNMNMYQEAKEAYAKAHELDPSNATYEQNLKLADELLNTQSGAGDSQGPSSIPTPNPLNLNNFLNNPALINMASQMISDPAFLNMTQQLAQQMQAANPNLLDTLRQTMGGHPPGGNPDNNPPEDPPQNQ